MIKKIAVENFKGIKELEVELDPQLVIVEGDNAEGKSTLLDTFRCIADGGGGLELIRNGESKAKLDLLLDDGVVLRKTITPKRPNLEAEGADGIPIPSPKEYVNSLMEGIGFDPLRFVQCDKKERLAYLLQVAPIRFEPAELAAIGIAPPATAVDLTSVAAIEDGIRAARKRANADVKSAEGTITRLEKDLPPDDGIDYESQWQELEEVSADVEVQVKQAERQAQEEYTASVEVLKSARDKSILDLQAQIAALEKRIGEVGKRCEIDIADRRDERDAKLKRVTDVAKPERERLAAAKAQAWERSQNRGRIAGQRETIKAMKDDAKAKFVESEKMTHSLELLTELRNKKLSTLPVEGVRITPDGDIFYDDVAFGELNTATQFMLSFQFARLKGGRFMLADHGECLGAQAWLDFCHAIRSQERDTKSQVQVVVAVRTKGSLSVHPGPTLAELAKGISGLREKVATSEAS